MTYHIGIVSSKGNQRTRNEDAYALPAWVHHDKERQHERGYVYPKPVQEDINGLLFLVADGVGGSEKGGAASRLAIETLIDKYYKLTTPHRQDLRLERAVNHTNHVVHTFAKSAQQKASTTLVGLLHLGKTGFITNIGDSRTYRIRKDNITLLTQDHSTRDDMIRSGLIRVEDGISIPASHISRSIGSQPAVNPDIFEIDIEPDDQFVLCTDGLTRHVNDDEILTHLTENQNPQQAANLLLDLALQRGGKDNITVLVIKSPPVFSLKTLYKTLRILALVILVLGLLGAIWLTYMR